MSKKQLAIVVLAAGEGKRMNSKIPKVMHMLAGRPMIGWLLESAQELKPQKMIVVIGPDMEDLAQAVKPCKTVVQEKRDGTAGAVRAAMKALDGFTGDVMVLLGDAPLVRPGTLKQLWDLRHAEAGTGISVIGMELANPAGYGRLLIDHEGVLHNIIEERDASPQERMIPLVNSGAICVDGMRLKRWLDQVDNRNAQKEYYITDLPRIAAKDGIRTRVYICPDPAEMTGCNTRLDLCALEKAVQQRMRYAFAESGVHMTDPETVYFHYDTALAPGVTIEPFVFFGPAVHVGKQAHIRAFSHLEGTDIAAGAVIGPYARLRPGSVIGKDARVGNFVEIKKSTIGERSKINHLAYVGDCDMDSDVNFSAGAITVNYDGFQKHKTKIGKGVMVGSNVNLVAPLSIDDGAFIAAGSTITEDVPADALSIARDTAEIRKGWAAEYRKRKAALVKKLGRKK